MKANKKTRADFFLSTCIKSSTSKRGTHEMKTNIVKLPVKGKQRIIKIPLKIESKMHCKRVNFIIIDFFRVKVKQYEHLKPHLFFA